MGMVEMIFRHLHAAWWLSLCTLALWVVLVLCARTYPVGHLDLDLTQTLLDCTMRR